MGTETKRELCRVSMPCSVRQLRGALNLFVEPHDEPECYVRVYNGRLIVEQEITFAVAPDEDESLLGTPEPTHEDVEDEPEEDSASRDYREADRADA